MNLEQIKACAEARYQEAEKMLEEAIRNNQAADTQFWRGYREAAQRFLEAVS